MSITDIASDLWIRSPPSVRRVPFELDAHPFESEGEEVSESKSAATTPAPVDSVTRMSTPEDLTSLVNTQGLAIFAEELAFEAETNDGVAVPHLNHAVFKVLKFEKEGEEEEEKEEEGEEEEKEYAGEETTFVLFSR